MVLGAEEEKGKENQGDGSSTVKAGVGLETE